MASSREYVFIPFKMGKIEPTGNKFTGHHLPKPRSGHRCIIDESNLYSFGGYNPHISVEDEEMRNDQTWQESCPLFRELWRFNLATKCWIKVNTDGCIPKELASHAAVMLGQCLLVYGGTGVPFGLSSSNSLHVCNLHTYQWKEIKTFGKAPQKQYGQAITLVDDSLYVIGGTTGYEYSSDVHRLDLKSGEWEDIPFDENAKPSERYRHEVACVNGVIYVFGGGTAMESFDLCKIPSFYVKEKKWKYNKTIPDSRSGSRKKFPSRRRCHSLVQKDNDIVVCGGYNGVEIFSDIWHLNTRTMQWSKLKQELPQPVYFHSSALTPSGCMYIFGGVTHIMENTRTADVYKMWLVIPKLKEMCWEALLYYLQNVGTVPRDTLLELGVPSEFVDRIDYQAVCG